MVDKTELIRRRMARTREALRQKLDALEDRTLGVVKDTSEAVTQVAETVEGTVESATQAIEKSAKILDLPRQVDRHPWAMMGGAVVTGCIASCLLSRTAQGGRRDSRQAESPQPTNAFPPVPPPPAKHSSLLSGLVEKFRPELESLKNLAIAASVEMVRDMATRSAPPQWANEVKNIFNMFTEHLGAKPQEEQAAPAKSDKRLQEESQHRWEDRREKKRHGNGRHSQSSRHN